MVEGCAAVIGTLSGFALSFTSLPPLIMCGVVGSVLPVLLLCVMSSNKFIDMAIRSIDKQLNKFNKYEVEECLKGFNRCFRVYKKYLNSNSLERHVWNVIEIGIIFLELAGLVALGFTSHAAIGALTIIIAPIICIALSTLTNKAIECFSSKESEQPDGSLIDEVRVEEGSHILHP